MKFAAVTACPTGIAHSQMAAENLEQTAERLGHDIKVEVQGAMGAENELSAGDVAAVDAVIIAADTAVSRDRFDDVPVVKGTVKDAVNDPEALIEEALEAAGADGDAVAAGSSGTEASEATSSGTEASEATSSGTETSEATSSGAQSSGAQSSGASQPPKRGGDREKSIIYRLKRFFS